MFWLVAAFVPWIIYWVCRLLGLDSAAPVISLILAAVLTLYPRRPLKLFALVTLGFFALHLIADAFDSSVLAEYGTAAAGAALAAAAAVSLARRVPFTHEYTCYDWHPLFWNDALFQRTNRIISTVWIPLFVTIGVLGLFESPWLKFLTPVVIGGAGGLFSIWFASWYPLRENAKILKAREPYNWPEPIFAPVRPNNDTDHDVIVIGAGIGGLTAAALLARRGLRVLVAEQRFSVGGYCTSWERGVRSRDNRNLRLRYVFDAGVYNFSGMGEGGTIRNVLRQLGVDDRLNWQHITHEYWLDGIRMKVPRRVDDYIRRLQAQFPAEKDGIAAFFAEMETFNRELFRDMDKTGGIVIYPPTPQARIDFARTRPHAYYWMDVPYLAMLDRYIHDARLRKLLTMITNYLGDDAAALTVLEVAPLFQYYFEGPRYPCGGSQAFADLLAETVRQHGGVVRLRTAVRRVVVEQGRAAGVELANGEIHRAEVVISNADARRTFTELVAPEHLPPDFLKRMTDLQASTSAFMVFLGLDCVPDIEPVTALNADGRNLWIAVTSKADASLAPAGHASVSLSMLLPQSEIEAWDRKVPGYVKRKREMGGRLIDLAEQAIPGLRTHIIYRQEASPATFTRFAWPSDGAIYGLAAGQQRPPMKAPIERLYLVGSNVFPGPGIEAVVTSGATAANMIYGSR